MNTELTKLSEHTIVMLHNLNNVGNTLTTLDEEYGTDSSEMQEMLKQLTGTIAASMAQLSELIVEWCE